MGFGSLRRKKKSRAASVERHDDVYSNSGNINSSCSNKHKNKTFQTNTTEHGYPEDEFDDYPMIEDSDFPG